MGFPRDDYTPFGLLANPWAFARSWTDGSGGVLRATEQRPGFGWLEPWGLAPKRSIALEVGFADGERAFLTRGDFASVGLRSAYHSANLFEYEWAYRGLVYRVRFYATSPDAITADWIIRNTTPDEMTAQLLYGPRFWISDSEPASLWKPLREQTALGVSTFEGFGSQPTKARSVVAERVAGRDGKALRGLHTSSVRVPAEGKGTFVVTLGRGAPPREPTREPMQTWPAQTAVREVRRSWSEREAELLTEDDAFWATCPQLSGDWPAEFRRGFVYDFETTRMCLQPAGGIFKNIWPAWMVNWPRVVLAEGSLDMLRLSFAAPELAQRAVLSMFRDAPAPNVPCVFRHGEPNMVAADGSVCGTSPAWCVPFHNLRRLYLRTLDRAWLGELYPYLAAYVRWWVANRSDGEGWCVYRCTWEAGEDNSTRLDPDGEGDHVISQYARPLELQAAMADAASTLAFFGRELGRPDEGWGVLETAALERTRQLWDRGEGRFRDLDARRGRFIEPSGRNDYWGTDPRRFSALALTPLLFGQTSGEQTAALRREIEHYAGPPWCDWPSWSYVVLEAASRAGFYDFVGRMAFDICRRVYGENDRRDLGSFERPMPGVAREYWPTDLSTWNASEGYGWGATTASFVIRQLCGFYEAEEPDGWAFRLAPAFPDELIGGRELGIGPLPYRGRVFYLGYRLVDEGALDVEVRLDGVGTWRVADERTGARLFDGGARASASFRLPRGQVARVELLS